MSSFIVTHVHQLSLGERQQFVGQRLIGQVIEEQFAVVVGIVARNALFVVQHQLVADAEDHVTVRLLREEPFAQQARRFDISGLATRITSRRNWAGSSLCSST